MHPTLSTAFVLGAGLGTRLKTLTAHRPKPLIPVCNRLLITHAFDHLLEHGVERFVVNTHWKPDVYDLEFPDAEYAGAPLAFRHEPEILETAGGILNVQDLLGDQPFIVYNGDILSTIPLDDAFRFHLQHEHEVTMVLRSKDGPLQVALDERTGRVTDIGGVPDGKPRYLFTGIYLVSPTFLRRIPPATKVGVVPIFRDMIRLGARLSGVIIDEGHWWDLGHRDQYLAVHREIAEGVPLLFSDMPPLLATPPWLAPGAEVFPSAVLTGATAVGAGARIGAGAHLRDTIVWAGAEVAAGSELTECIVTEGARVSGVHAGVDF